MADGGVIKVVSLRCKKICGVFMLFVLSFQVFIFSSAWLPAAVDTNPLLL
jgi:hypothetical protein